MATAYEGRKRNEALRELSRFELSFAYEGENFVFRIKPKGFNTALAELRSRPGASNQDLIDVGNAIRTLARIGKK
jgi:hypothetical protein